MLKREQLMKFARDNGFAGVAEIGGEVRMPSEVFWTRLERFTEAMQANAAPSKNEKGCSGGGCGSCAGGCRRG